MNDDDLSTLERELIEHAAAGTTCDVSGRPNDDGRVCAEVIHDLCVGAQWAVHAKGIRLTGARIEEPLDFEHATLRAPLRLHDCDLRGAVNFNSAIVPALDLAGSKLTQRLQLARAKITDDLELAKATLTGVDGAGNALFADGLHVGGSMILSEGFEAAGAIRLAGANIDAQLDMSGAKLTGHDGNALVADRLHVGGDAILSEGFEAAGAIHLSGANIDGQLDMSGAKLTGTDSAGDALVADRLHVGGVAFLSQGFEAVGTIRLPGANIDAELVMSGAKLTGRAGDALVADRLHVGGDAFLSEGFEAAGAICLAGGSIDGQLVMTGAKLTSTDSAGDALVADGLHVGGDAFLSEGFEAAGVIRLDGARIDGQLAFVRARAVRRLDLQDARCGQLADNEESWPPSPGSLVLKGFRFDSLIADTGWHQRLEWVRLQGFDDWSPDPYEQLASYYTGTGNEAAARRVQVAKHDDELTHLKTKKESLAYRFWRKPFGWLVGYGYRRHRAGWLLALTLVGAGLMFRWAEAEGAIVPNEPTQDSASRPDPCGEAYPCFNSLVYGADVVLPIIDFGQDGAWRPTESPGPGPLWIWARWAFIALGWALASVFVAAFTGLVQRS